MLEFLKNVTICVITLYVLCLLPGFYMFIFVWLLSSRDGQCQDTCIGDTFVLISVSIKGVFVHSRYEYLDTVFEHEQFYQVLSACSLTVFEECENKLKLFPH